MSLHTRLYTQRRPDDFHVHLRQGEMLKGVLPYTARDFVRATVMPNTKPGIYDAAALRAYREAIMYQVQEEEYDFTPLMTIKITEATTPQQIIEAHEAGAIAGKIYPRGKTTNAEDGVVDYRGSLTSVYSAMEECGMLLLLHGETPEECVLTLHRESRFLPTLVWIAETFVNLKVVLEHVSSAHAANTVCNLRENVAATVTVHHLLLTHDDVVDEKIRPHHHCMPTPKDYADRDALLTEVLLGSPNFFLGTDSAPHARDTKECAEGCSGVFTAPVAMAVLAELFESHNALAMLEDFTSRFGAEFYGLPLNEGTITLERHTWTVPSEYAGVVPFRAGQELPWRVLMTDKDEKVT